MRLSVSNFLFKLFTGILAGVFFPAWLWWIFLPAAQISWKSFSLLHITSFSISLIVFLLNFSIVQILSKFPGHKNNSSVLYALSSVYFIAFTVLLLFRLPYSNSFLISSFTLSGLFLYVDYSFYKNSRTRKIHYIPLGNATELEKITEARWLKMNEPILPQPQPLALVADLHSPDLSPTWGEFLAHCTLQGIPVYNVRQVEESLSGRVKIEHMYENNLGSLLPSSLYMFIKTVLEASMAATGLLLASPVMLLTAILIKLEDNGKILYSQQRVGYRNRVFKIYKFRSMKADAEKKGARFAGLGDSRVTHVGKFIRKSRIDELPQLFNVLKGEMSLIGPRPEQRIFVEQFKQKIPFYEYRHIVKPGITGWAQVMQGYAAEVDETKIKVQYDFYYIKNFSFALDILIFLKTIKIILTGFGAR